MFWFKEHTCYAHKVMELNVPKFNIKSTENFRTFSL